MMPLKTFDDYLKEGIARKQSPDKLRSMSLVAESTESYGILFSFIGKVGLDDNNANHVIKNAYDIIMELIRAKMFSDGFSTSGKGAHEAEVSYLNKLGFSDRDVNFANDLRWFRNGIMYYGKKFDKNYAERVIEFLKRIYLLLKKMCEKPVNKK
ncbi:MAG: hypothetical protein HY513_01680 [Candidatus Aenigmarchaeota archaeon]|nr:hypothetical protein [Candidatus Aenigmarchaeota archaeon]